MKKRQLKGIEKPRRGRKPNTEKIVSNGLFKSQWEQIQCDAKAENIEAAVLHRRIVSWYYTAKQQQAERQEAEYTHVANFQKLLKEN